LILTVVPSDAVRNTMFSNCSGVVKRPSAMTLAEMPCLSMVGVAPMEPEANCTFWPRIALRTALGARP
jgi:hypothetical protein